MSFLLREYGRNVSRTCPFLKFCSCSVDSMSICDIFVTVFVIRNSVFNSSLADEPCSRLIKCSHSDSPLVRHHSGKTAYRPLTQNDYCQVSVVVVTQNDFGPYTYCGGRRVKVFWRINIHSLLLVSYNNTTSKIISISAFYF